MVVSWRWSSGGMLQKVGWGMLCSALVVIFAGCGGGQATSTPAAASAAHAPEAIEKPLPGPNRALGRRACEGMTPLEAARHYERAALRAGASARLVELVTEPPLSTEQSQGYPRLVAAFYATTLPPVQRAAAAAGCAEELAAPARGGKAAPVQAQRENAAS